MRANIKDLACGILFVAIGLFFILNSWWQLRIGRAFEMGPGYFPILLGLILAGLGITIAIGSIGKPSEAFGRVSWRGTLLISLSVLVFAVTVRPLGMLPALLMSTFIAAYSTNQATFRSAIMLTTLLTAFNIGVFIYALRLPYRVIGPWLWSAGS
jgi:hypothetical protein